MAFLLHALLHKTPHLRSGAESPQMRGMALLLRHGHYHLRRRVPRRYGPVEDRKEVWISLKTDSRAEAEQKTSAAWEAMIASWEARLRGDDIDAKAAMETAREICQRRGFRYLPVDRVAALPLEDLVARVEAVANVRGKPDMVEARALLGAAQSQVITVSRALELYWDMAQDRALGKSRDQVRRWKNPRKKAIRNFIDVIGDIPIQEITRDNLLDFMDWWLERVKTGAVTPNSANKDLTHIGSTIRMVEKKLRLGLDISFADLTIKEGEKSTRPPFSEDWIRTKLLAPGALDGLNGQARAILIGMINTGYRPSEGAMLTRDLIRLDGPVPHISIEPVGRTLKSQYARRIVPLTGVSLEAFKAYPDGFPRYADNPTLSDTVNKFLTANGLRETAKHSLYSLRHSFEDRLLDDDVDERVRRDLMGHTLNRERYGKGPSLEKLHGILQRIAI